MQAIPPHAYDAFGDIAPRLAELADPRLFGQIWRRPLPTPREHRLVRVAALTASARTVPLRLHLQHAQDNGLGPETPTELIALRTFDGGWPASAACATDALRTLGTREIA